MMNNEDVRNLDLLAIFHYVMGGLLAMFSCFPIIHVVLGVLMLTGGLESDTNSVSGQPAPEIVGWMFVIMGGGFIMVGWLVSVCIIVAGKKLKRRQNRMFCLVMAGVECTFMPLGTVLGVFTLINLTKPSVKELFDANNAGEAETEVPS